MLANFFDRVIFRLFSRYESIKERRRQEHFRRIAMLAATANIGSEGAIENVLGNMGAVMIGENSWLRGRIFIYGHGGKVSLGNWCYVGVRSEIWSMDTISIGNRVLISHDVNIHDGTAHSINARERHEHYRKILTTGHPRTWDEMPGVKSVPIVIEDDVWISFGVTILKGVRIGAGAVVAASSVVTKDVPPYCVVAGNPAQVVRELEQHERQ